MITLEEKCNELWDLYDSDRNKIGRTHLRGTLLKAGEYHLVVHVCIFNNKDQLLIQKRQPWKHWGGFWDISAGGSAITGDTSRQAAERETFEEIGFKPDLHLERPFLTILSDESFHDYYLIEENLDIDKLQLQEEEVQAVKWADKKEIIRMIEQGEFMCYHKGLLDCLFEMRRSRGITVKM